MKTNTPKPNQQICPERSRGIFPELRFKEFTDEWQEKKLGDIADVKGGKRIPKGYSLQLENNGFPYLTVSGMKNGGIDFDELRFVPETIIDQIKNYKIFVDDIYISVAGTLGLIGTIPIELDGANLTENANKLTNIKIDRDFLLQYLKSDRLTKLVKNVKTDNAQPKLAIYALQKFKMQIPDKREQSKIADFLTVVDEKISHLESKKTQFEKYKKGVMQLIFPAQGGQAAKIRFKDDNRKDYPDWEEKKMGDTAMIYDGTHQTPEYKEFGVPFYSVEHITSDNFEDTKYVEEEVYERESKRIQIEKGDILMTRIGDIGTSKYINWDARASFYVSLALIKKSGHLDTVFLDQYIKTDKFQHELWQRTIHVAFPKKINLGEIGDCVVIVPDKEEQEKIAGFLTSLDNKVELINNQLEQAKLFKKSLLQQLFV